MRTNVWARATTRFAIPELPDTWGVSGPVLFRAPTEWLLTGLVKTGVTGTSRFRLELVVQLLAIPTDVLGGIMVHPLGHAMGTRPNGRPRGYFDDAANLEDAEPIMLDMADLIRRQGIPMFDDIGTLPGFTRYAEEGDTDSHHRSVHHLEHVYVLRLIQGDVDRAMAAATLIPKAAEDNGRNWAFPVAERVTRNAALARHDLTAALDELRANAAEVRAHFKIPLVA